MDVREHQAVRLYQAKRLGLILSDVVLSLKELQRRRRFETRRRKLLPQINDMKSESEEKYLKSSQTAYPAK